MRSLNNICRTSKEYAGGQTGWREGEKGGKGGRGGEKDTRKDAVREQGGIVPLLYFSTGIVKRSDAPFC